jgi:hypothetical protein
LGDQGLGCAESHVQTVLKCAAHHGRQFASISDEADYLTKRASDNVTQQIRQSANAFDEVQIVWPV